MRAEPLARRTLTTLEAKAGASSGNNASSSPGEIKRWPITTPGKARASIADWSEGSTVILILGRDYRFRGSCALRGQQTRNARVNNSSCNQRRAWRCGEYYARGEVTDVDLAASTAACGSVRLYTANDFARCQSFRCDPAGPIDHATRRNCHMGGLTVFQRVSRFSGSTRASVAAAFLHT